MARYARKSSTPTSASFPTLIQWLNPMSYSLLRLKSEGKTLCGLGASTKGNVVLQYCGIDATLLSCIAEVNEDKYGCFTPGTEIPIVSEADASARRPDVYLVLPWHFRRNILTRAAPLFAQGAKLLFPLPEIEIVSSPDAS